MAIRPTDSFQQIHDFQKNSLTGYPKLLVKILGSERIQLMHTPNKNADTAYKGYVYRDDLEQYKELRLSDSSFVFSCIGQGILAISKEKLTEGLGVSYHMSYDEYYSHLDTSHEVILEFGKGKDDEHEKFLRELFARKSLMVEMQSMPLGEWGEITLQLVEPKINYLAQ